MAGAFVVVGAYLPPEQKATPISVSPVSMESYKVVLGLEASRNALWVSESHIVGILKVCVCGDAQRARMCKLRGYGKKGERSNHCLIPSKICHKLGVFELHVLCPLGES
jgi:hypothetical protein